MKLCERGDRRYKCHHLLQKPDGLTRTIRNEQRHLLNRSLRLQFSRLRRATRKAHLLTSGLKHLALLSKMVSRSRMVDCSSSLIQMPGMDMLNFASPLTDFFVSPQSMEEHMDTTTSDSTFENWLSVNPSDTQLVCAQNQNTSPFSDSVQLESITPEQFRTGSIGSSISSVSSGFQSTTRPGSEIYSANSQDSAVQQLLYLHSTLQRILTVYNNGGDLNWDNAWTPQTATEETFLATDKLVAVMEGLSHQSTPSTPASGSATSALSTQREIEHPTKSQPGADSTSLLVLSCYICALEVYQAQLDSMKDQVNDIIREPCSTAQNGGSDSPSRASSLVSSANIMPVLNIGQFNLGMSPMRNLSLLLHLTQDMVERLQGAVQQWSSIGDNKNELQMSQNGDDGFSDLTQRPNSSRSRKDSVLDNRQEHKTQHAMSSVFDSVLAGVQSREKMLGASMQDVKNILKSR